MAKKNYKHRRGDIEIFVSNSRKAPRHQIIIFHYDHKPDIGEHASCMAGQYLNEEEYKIWRKGTMFQKLQMVMEIFKDNIELDETHRPSIE